MTTPLSRVRPRSSRRPTAAAALGTTLTALTALALAAPASADPTGGADPGVDPAALHVLERTNAARAAAGCGPLVLDPALAAAAQQHTVEMAATGTMSHTGADGSSPRTRLAAVGSFPVRTAENVAVGYDADGVVAAWLASPGHRANVLDCRLAAVGVAQAPGAVGTYWTQVFAGWA
ncbi:CAP domain-containing protein [Kineococcus sp. LSe6-4]|uniref:CAP domain-containing protein n=1 Tax=Kineococcus halophytocola TaxID=3234027 RepID=A0ABV4H1H4_9ACTN